MRRPWLLGILIVCAIAVVWWFWSLGNVPLPSDEPVTIVSTSGTVQIRAADGGWQDAKAGQVVVPGNEIKTEAGSAATLGVGVVGEARLPEQSDLMLADGSAVTPSTVNVKLILNAGHVWSHVSRLLSLADTYEVDAANTSSTARGTSFDVSVTPTGAELDVEASAVRMHTGSNSELILAGQRAQASAGFIRFSTLPSAVASSAWYEQNVAADAAFDAARLARVESKLAAEHAPTPGGLSDLVARASESLHLAVSQGNPTLAAAYATKRLYAIIQLADAGSPGMALEAMQAWQQQVTGDLQDHPAGEQALARAADVLFAPVNPDAPAYRLKQAWSDTDAALRVGDAGEARLRDLLNADDRLQEASEVMASSTVEATSALAAADAGLAVAAHELDVGSLRISLNDARTLTDRLIALSGEEQADKDQLAAIEASSTLTATTPAITPWGATSTTSTVAATSTTPVATSTARVVSLTVRATPPTLSVGEPVRLDATAAYSDGHLEDVTEATAFAVVSGPAELDGDVLTATAAGTVHVSGSARVDGTTVDGGLTLENQSKSNLSQGLYISVAQTRLLAGTSTPLHVYYVDADGNRTDVTSSCTFQVDKPNIASVTGGQLVVHAAGNVTVTAGYIQNGRPYSAIQPFTLITSSSSL